MKKQRVSLSIAFLTITFLAGMGDAATVTFDNYSPLDVCASPISSEGLTFTGPPNTCYSNNLAVWEGNSPNGKGTPALIYGFNGSVAMTLTGGGAFSLQDFQMTISWYDDSPSEDIMLTADYAGGGHTSQMLTLIQGLQTYTVDLY